MKTAINGILFCLIGIAGIAAAEDARCGMGYLAEHADRFALPRAKPLAVQQAAAVEVGTPLDFLVAGDLLLRAATCRYVGEHCYIFVDDPQWDTNGGSIFQSDVDALGKLFDSSTPADSERGIYDLAVESFGSPADVDGDERIFILVLDIGDPRLVGFFDPQVANWPDPVLRRDTIYLDAGALRSRSYLARGTLAHEFQHLIHWGHDEDEEAWIDEGLSGYAEELTGFPETDTSMVEAFLRQPDFNLTVWPPIASAANYGVTYLFMSFLAERYGGDVIRALVAEPRNGINGIDAAFAASDLVQNYDGVWAQWIVANYASDDDLNGYSALAGRRARVFLAPGLSFDEIEGVVSKEWGATNILFRADGAKEVNIAVEFRGEDSGRYSVWGYAMRNQMGEVVEMELEGGISGHLEVSGVDSMALIVGRTSNQGGRFWLSASEFEITAVTGEEQILPAELALEAVYPNPFNGQAVIPFFLPQAITVDLALYDALGQRVKSLHRGMHAGGRFEAVWDGRDEAGKEAASGVYLAILKAGDRRLVRRLSLVK